MKKVQIAFEIDHQLREKFKGTTVDIYRVATTFKVIPCRRNKDDRMDVYMRDSYYDDLEKIVYEHFIGHHVDLKMTVNWYKKNSLVSPQEAISFINLCVGKIWREIVKNKWHQLIPNIIETQKVLEPILNQIERDASLVKE